MENKKTKLSDLMEGIAVDCSNTEERDCLIDVLDREGVRHKKGGRLKNETFYRFVFAVIRGKLVEGFANFFEKHRPIKPFSELITEYRKLNSEPVAENYADRSKWTLEDFDVERAKRGDLVCTREGKPIHLTCITDNSVQCNTGDDFLRWEPTGEFQGTERSLDLFHPVSAKEVKKKRIDYDKSLVGKEGVTIECREQEYYEFVSILTDSFNDGMLVHVRSPRTNLNPDFAVQLTNKGLKNEGSESTCDLVMLVPDTEPALPSGIKDAMEVAENYASKLTDWQKIEFWQALEIEAIKKWEVLIPSESEPEENPLPANHKW